ncbi:hypothetical protein EUGRSUZ_G00125 [Eucalyptus grandis]|uniref:Uncharacterized protein n=2 Tax=Eucalyptus grandis TaxID=71139 RepID=A0ACC3JZK1_EUCGR|nr:hypothetical protein EUGRSUZ_G00125 [Eucalyptus grandis]
MMKRTGMLMLLCSMLVTSCVGSIWKKTCVTIRNNLTDESTLTVHCKSKNDDLGIHCITQLQRPFSWPDRFEWFNMYVQSRDEGKCIFCSWTISLNGLTGEYDLCYHWNRRS